MHERWMAITEYHDGRVYMSKECKTSGDAEIVGKELLRIHGVRNVRFYIVQVHFSIDS